MTTEALVDKIVEHRGCTVEVKDLHGGTHFFRYLTSGEIHSVDPLEAVDLFRIREFKDTYIDGTWAITAIHGATSP